MTIRLFDHDLLCKAADFAEKVHRGQKRKYGDEDYIRHPERVAQTVWEQVYATTDMVAAAWLHDVIEDCDVTYGEILSLFGNDVARMVDGLTKPKGMSKIQYYVKLQSEYEDVCRIKLADRLDNVANLFSPAVPDDFRRYYIKDTRRLLECVKWADKDLAKRVEACLEPS